jgi:DNA-binding Xre family transcriptional regulator
MLHINLRKILTDRGIERPIPFLQKIGLARYTAQGMLDDNCKYLGLEHAERICLALKCSPNDLLEWRPDAGVLVPSDHPLHKLRPKEQSLSQQLQQLSADELEAVQQFIGTLKQDKGE